MGGTAGVPVIGYRHLGFALSAVMLAFPPILILLLCLSDRPESRQIQRLQRPIIRIPSSNMHTRRNDCEIRQIIIFQATSGNFWN